MIPRILTKRQTSENRKSFKNPISEISTENLYICTEQFSETINYTVGSVGKSRTKNKCIAIRTHGVFGIATAAFEMNLVASKNYRCEDPAYHFILSWPEREQPDSDAIFDAAEHAIRSIGLSDHQYVIVIQGNTDNIHCQIAANRIHPDTYQSQDMERSKSKLHLAARESEILHGWSHDTGIYIVEQDINNQKHIVLNTKHTKGRLS